MDWIIIILLLIILIGNEIAISNQRKIINGLEKKLIEIESKIDSLK